MNTSPCSSLFQASFLFLHTLLQQVLVSDLIMATEDLSLLVRLYKFQSKQSGTFDFCIWNLKRDNSYNQQHSLHPGPHFHMRMHGHLLRLKKRNRDSSIVSLSKLQSFCVVVCLSNLYGNAKERSGPLKLGIQAVERMVNIVVAPIYNKFHDVPFELFRFINHRVESKCRPWLSRCHPKLFQLFRRLQAWLRLWHQKFSDLV